MGRGGRSASLLESIVAELVIKREMTYDGESWLDDVEAERWVIRHMWKGQKPAAGLNASHFYYPYHKYLFALSLEKAALLREGEEITAAVMVGLECLRRYEKALDDFPTLDERQKLIGRERVVAIEAIESVAVGRPFMPFAYACKRVTEFAWRRHAHYSANRLRLLLEQPTLDDKDVRKTFGVLRDHLTELFKIRRGEDGGGRSEAPRETEADAVRPMRQSGTVRCASRDVQSGDGATGTRSRSIPSVPPSSHGLSQRKRSVP